MIRYACIAVIISLALSVAPTHASESDQAEIITASALMDSLVERGLLSDPTAFMSHTDDRLEQTHQTCSRTCQSQFVKGYESCTAAYAKLSPSADVDVTRTGPGLDVCGRAALSGLDYCRTRCGEPKTHMDTDQAKAPASALQDAK